MLPLVGEVGGGAHAGNTSPESAVAVRIRPCLTVCIRVISSKRNAKRPDAGRTDKMSLICPKPFVCGQEIPTSSQSVAAGLHCGARPPECRENWGTEPVLLSSRNPARVGTKRGSVVREVDNLCRDGKIDGALDLLFSMDQRGCVPPVPVYRSLLQACMKKKAIVEARQVCAHIAKHGLESDRALGDFIVTTLINCGSLADGLRVFQRLSKPAVFSWTALISGFGNAGRCREALVCYQQMQEAGVHPNNYTFVSLLKVCGRMEDLEMGKRIHADAVKDGFEFDVFVRNTLVSMYAKCGSIVDAEEVFDSLPKRDVVSWNAMLAAYSQQEQGADKALRMFYQMRKEGVKPDAWTLSSVLQACGTLAELEKSEKQRQKSKFLETGKEIHAVAASLGYGSNCYVGSSLVSMYAKCGSVVDAQLVFDGLSKRDVVAWNAILAAYAQLAQGEQGLQIYAQMQQEGIKSNSRTFVSVFQACGSLAEKEESALVHGQYVKVQSLAKGRKLHAEAALMGLESDVFVGNSLVSMYSKCGSVTDACRAFDGLSHRDVVSWSAMIAAYAAQGEGEKALQAYRQMQLAHPKLDETTCLSVLEACSSTGALDTCKQIHQSMIVDGIDKSLSIATSLIHSYGKCGSMEDAQRVFDLLPQPDVVSWTAMIAGYSRQGDCQKSIECYNAMCERGLKPDGVTFMALLSACSHAGLVDEGLAYFENMTREYGIAAIHEHYVCAIDLVGRSGRFKEAEDLILQMPMEPKLSLWLCLLGACQKHGNVVVGRRAFNHAIALEPTEASAYVLMSNIYTDAGMWEYAHETRVMRDKACAWKKPGQSWIEHEQEVHTFLVGDRRHQQQAVVYEVLETLKSELRRAGYVPHQGCIL